MKKAIIFGYHEIGCILLDELRRNNIKVELIIGDYRKHDSQTNTWYRDIRKVAGQKKIKIIDRKNLKSKKTIEIIKKIKPNLIFCAYTNFILNEEIANIPNLGCYNFHNSDLPEDKGRGAPIYTIAKGKRETALTMHFISPKIDSGKIVDKEKIYIEKKDDIKRLYLKHNLALKKILDRQLPKIKYSKLSAYEQKKNNEKLNLWIEGKSDFLSFQNLTVKEIINKVYSLKYPFRGAKSLIKKKYVNIHDVEIYKAVVSKHVYPGSIFKIETYDIIVKAKDGFIKIKEISELGRHILPAHFCLINKINKSMKFR